MADSSDDRDPLDRLAEEFVARFRAGERPSLTEYAARLPDRADEVRELFPALVELEQLKPNTSDRTGDYAPAVGPSDPTQVGEFRILRRVGVGGMGAVYEAIQESLGRHVALKLLPLDAVADPKRLERFRREAKAAARLHHTNIVPVYGTGEADGRHYYAMQFIAGHPLDAVIDEVKRLKDQSAARPPQAVSVVAAALVTGTFPKHPSPVEGEGGGGSPPGEGFNPDATLPAANTPASAEPSAVSSPSLSDGGRAYWSTVARLGAQAADALAYAHGQGVLHRDIKPANLLLDLRGTLWVADFGLAKSTDADDLTHTGDVIGTLRYMAPERFEGQGDQRADIYALGLTLYELLALQPAFQATSRAKLVELAIAANPPKPRSVNPAIPKDLETIVLKAIQRDPAMRYQTAGELADDLRRYLEDRPINARRASSAEQAYRWCRRNPAVAGLLTAVLLVFAIGAGVSAYFAVQAERKEQDARAEAKRADDERVRANEEAAKVKTGQEVLQANQYLWDMQMVPLVFESGTVAGVNRLLDRHLPAPGTADRRSFEWYFWDRRLNAQVLTERLPDAYDDSRSSWGVSEDGTRLARLTPPWNQDDPGRPKGIPPQDSPVLTVWDTTTRRKLLTHRLPINLPADQGTMQAVGLGPRLSPDGRRVEVEWSYSVRNPAKPGERFGPRPISLGKSVRQIIDVASGRALLELPRSGLEGWDFSRDGRYFATVSFAPKGRSSKGIEVWSLDTGKSITGPQASFPYSDIAFGPLAEEYVTSHSVPPSEPTGGLTAVVGGLPLVPQVRISVRELASGKEKRGWLVPAEAVGKLTISPDGTLLAATVQDWTVTVWELATGKQVSALKSSEPVSRLKFSPTGKRLEVRQEIPNRPGFGITPHVTTLNPRTGVADPPVEGRPKAEFNVVSELIHSPDGERVAAFDDNVLRVWNVKSGKLYMTFRGPIHPIVACGFSPDSKRVWSVERDGVFKEWDLNPPRPAEIPFEGGKEYGVADFALSGDGSIFAQLVGAYAKDTNSAEFAVRMRDSSGNKLKLLTPEPRKISPQEFTYASKGGVLLSPDGRRAVLTRAEDLTYAVGGVVPGEQQRRQLPPPDLTVWDNESGKTLFRTSLTEAALMPADGNNGHISAISSDGRVVAIATQPAPEVGPITVRMFDVETQSERPSLTLASANGLYNLTISPDGSRLAAVAYNDDKIARRTSTKLVVWDSAGGEPIAASELVVMSTPILGRGGNCRARIAWFADGSRFVVSHDSFSFSMLAIHSASTGKLIAPLELPNSSPGTFRFAALAIACSPDGKRVAALVATGLKSQTPEVKVWDAASGKELLNIQNQLPGARSGGGGPANGCLLRFDGNGHRLRACEFGEVPNWTEETGLGYAPAFILTTWDATPVPNRRSPNSQ